MSRTIFILSFILISTSQFTSSQSGRRTTPQSRNELSRPGGVALTPVQNQDPRTTPKRPVPALATTPRRTTPPRLPLITRTPSNAATTQALLKTPTKPNGGGLPDTPTPKIGSLPDTPTPIIGGLPDTPTPIIGGLPNTPTAKIGGLPDTPTPSIGGNSLPNTPTGGSTLPPTPSQQTVATVPNPVGNTLPQTPPGNTLPITPPPTTILIPPPTPSIPVTLPPTPPPGLTLGSTPPIFTTPTIPFFTTPTQLTIPTTNLISTTSQPTTTTTSVQILTTPTPATITATIVIITTVLTTGTTTPLIMTTSTTATTMVTIIPTPLTTPSTTTISAILNTPTISNIPNPITSTVSQNFPSTTSLVPLPPTSTTIPSTSNNLIDSSDANIMFLLCNDYKLTVPINNLAMYLDDLRMKIIVIIKTEDPAFQESRLHNLRLSENLDNAKLTLEFSIRPRLRSSEIKSSRIVELIKTQTLTDYMGNKYETSCGTYQILSWGENWKCPERFCSNGGKCNVKSNGRHYCHCSTGYIGRYCDDNLWPLLVLPILFVLGALTILCCCLYCRRKRRIVVKNFVNTNIEEAVVEPPKKEEPEKERPKPLQTFYLPYNKPLTVGFTDAQVGNVGVIPGMIGGPMMRAPMMGGVVSGNQAIYPMVGNGVTEDPDIYYQTMGQKMALAYNDYTFVPNPRASSAGNVVFHGQNNGSSNNFTTSFSSIPADNNVANDGSGYYHALGQKLAINFDNN